MFRTIFVISILILISAGVGAYDAPASYDVPPVFSHNDITSLIEKAIDAPSGTFLLKKKQVSELGHGYQFVFVEGGTRYTLHFNWYTPGIHVWLRPDSTYHPDKKAHAFSDCHLDGIVDFGADGIRIFNPEGADVGFDPGWEHKSYWQEMLNQFYADLDQFLEVSTS